VHVETRCNLIVLEPNTHNKCVHAPCLLYTLRVVQLALLAATYNAPFLPQLTSPPPTSRFIVCSCSAWGLLTSALSMSLGNTTQTNTNNAHSKSSFEHRPLTVHSNSTSLTKLWMIRAYHNLQLEWDQMLRPCPNPTGPSLVSAQRLNRRDLSTSPNSTGLTEVGQPRPCSNAPPPPPLTYQVPPICRAKCWRCALAGYRLTRNRTA
jgi:hypothetical protein